MKLFLVGKFIAETDKGIVWEYQGLWPTRDEAIAACRSWRYGFTLVETSKEVPDEPIEFDSWEYPIAPPAGEQL